MIFREFEQKIIKDINESGMPIDAVYFIMKNIIREIEEKYIEYCRIEDAEAAKKALESDQTNEEPVTANSNKEEGAN